MRQFVFGDVPFAETAQMLTSQSDMQAAVSGTIGSAGYGSWTSAVAAGADVQPIALNGVAPGDVDYPITTSLGISYLSDRQADVQPLVDWLLSEGGRAALDKLDVISPQ